MIVTIYSTYMVPMAFIIYNSAIKNTQYDIYSIYGNYPTPIEAMGGKMRLCIHFHKENIPKSKPTTCRPSCSSCRRGSITPES